MTFKRTVQVRFVLQAIEFCLYYTGINLWGIKEELQTWRNLPFTKPPVKKTGALLPGQKKNEARRESAGKIWDTDSFSPRYR